jgi:ribonuclease PH
MVLRVPLPFTARILLQVLAAVFGPHEVELRSQMKEDRAIIKCEYAMAAFSTGNNTHIITHTHMFKLRKVISMPRRPGLRKLLL